MGRAPATDLDSGRIPWPFVWVLDDQGRQTGWATLNGPVVTASQQDCLAKLRWSGYRLVGMSSYLDFPRAHTPDPIDYEAACEAWCHCFRDPDRCLISDIPRALISVSDFTDPIALDPAKHSHRASDHRSAFVYVCGGEDWQRQRKNWTLAAACIPLLTKHLGLQALVVGVPTNTFGPSSRVSFTAPLPRQRFLAVLAQARFLFVPNVLDASPRIIAEALCLDVPVVVNSAILGGWKYINNDTGSFFTSPDDVVSAVSRCLHRPVQPRTWFAANYGPDRAGTNLRELIRQVDPAIGRCGPLRLSSQPDAPTAAMSR